MRDSNVEAYNFESLNRIWFLGFCVTRPYVLKHLIWVPGLSCLEILYFLGFSITCGIQMLKHTVLRVSTGFGSLDIV